MQRVNDQRERDTLSDYHQRADKFWADTRMHDVSQNIQALLDALPSNRALDILDFGCGPGRDLLTFRQLGHRAVGLDGTLRFCEMAKRHSGCEVMHQHFSALVLPANQFDGVFANASLFHVPQDKLEKVLRQLREALKPQGVLFLSNPRGRGECFDNGRYAHLMEFDEIKTRLEASGFQVLDHYYRPVNRPREEQRWLAVVSRKCVPDGV